MTVRELFEYFLKDAHWVDRATTIDNIHFGDENTQIIKVGTGWSACAANLQAAAKDGCNLFISHELPFGWERRAEQQDLPAYQKCIKILEENNMVEMNLHDTWDHYPKIGIRDGFAKLLGLTDLVQEMVHFVRRQGFPQAVQALAGKTLHEEIAAAAQGAGEVSVLHPGHMGNAVGVKQLHGAYLSLHQVDLVGHQAFGVRGGDLQHGGTAVGEVNLVGGVEHALGQFGDGSDGLTGKGGAAQGVQGFGGLMILGDAHGDLRQYLSALSYLIPAGCAS
jgi:putative NIF3 family GTP cyclohydrolase 1 type 2